MAEQKIRDWRRAARAAIHSYPEIKQKTKDATNSDLWGPTDAQKCEIAEASHNAENRALVLKALWKRVEDKSDYWMHVYKALDVLEYLLLSNVPEMMNELKFHHQMISNLQMYAYAKHKDPMEQNKLNEKVRVKAGRLMQLMSDSSLLEDERKKLRLIMARITGISDQEIEGGSAPAATTTSTTATRAAAPPPASRPPASSNINAPGNRSSMNLPGHTAEAGRIAGGGGGNGGEAQAGDEFELDLDVLTQVMDMGFTDQDAVVSAMMAADNNLERTVQYLVSNAPKSPVDQQQGKAPATAAPSSAPAGPTSEAPIGGRGMTDLFAPPPTTATAGGGGTTAGTGTGVTDLFGGATTAATTTPAVAVAQTTPAGGQGLWNGDMTQAPPPTTNNPPPQQNNGFDPFAPTPVEAPKAQATANGSGAMPDFFSTTQTPQEAHKRGGMTPPPMGGGQQADLFGAPTMPVQQQTDLFGGPGGGGAVTTTNPPQQQTDLFGGSSAPAVSNTNNTVGTSNDLFGGPNPSPPSNNTTPTSTTSSPAAVSSSQGAAAKKQLTPAEKMMMEFQNMGNIGAKKK